MSAGEREGPKPYEYELSRGEERDKGNTYLETTEVLQCPELDGAISRGCGQHLVCGRELDIPEATSVA